MKTNPKSKAIRRGVLPCPFCATSPVMKPWHGGKPTKVMIMCENENCDVSPSVTGETPKEAIARWNTRKLDDTVVKKFVLFTASHECLRSLESINRIPCSQQKDGRLCAPCAARIVVQGRKW